MDLDLGIILIIILWVLVIILLLLLSKPSQETKDRRARIVFLAERAEERAITNERQNVHMIACKCGRIPFMAYGEDINCWKCYDESLHIDK